MRLRSAFLSLIVPALILPLSIATAQTSAAPKRTCPVDSREQDAGDKALAMENYGAAEIFYRTAIKTNPNSVEAHLGLVRALLGKDDVAASRAEAAALSSVVSNSSIAEVAAAEVDYRAASLDDAQDHIIAAMQRDPCDGRALASAAKLVTLNAMYAQAARYLATAHILRPNDELIRRDWIDSLPADQREAELIRYIEGSPSLSAGDRLDLTNEAQELKARQKAECRVTSVRENVTLPFSAVLGESVYRTEAYGLDTQFNGQHRNMEIDTGASGIILTPSAAKRLKLTPEYTLKTGGIGDSGDVESYLTHVAKIQIGDVEFDNCMVEVLSKADMHADGLIGLDVFRNWLVTLDYKKHQLRLDPLPVRPGGASIANGGGVPHDRYIAPEMADWLHILRIGHQLLLPARLNKGPTRYLVADSGAGLTSFSPAFARDGGKLHPNNDLQIRGLSGYVKDIFRVDLVTLRFGDLSFGPRSYPAFDITSISHASGFEISGLLGLPDLSRMAVSIDYRDNLMQLKFMDR